MGRTVVDLQYFTIIAFYIVVITLLNTTYGWYLYGDKSA